VQGDATAYHSVRRNFPQADDVDDLDDVDDVARGLHDLDVEDDLDPHHRLEPSES
jgi:hypothetical protein